MGYFHADVVRSRRAGLDTFDVTVTIPSDQLGIWMQALADVALLDLKRDELQHVVQGC